MLHDAGDMSHESWNTQDRDDVHDQVGTVEVQILLSWFFESSSPNDLHIDIPQHETREHDTRHHHHGLPRAA
jgi:hypothetical protein